MADNDNQKQPEYGDDEQESGVFRWMSAMVVLLAVAGFFGLAWYAYKSGGEAVDERDVEVVKADKAPVKETPVAPGGMQFPNQDKTVYGLIGEKADKPNVERILPAPEEPVTRGSNTETWMSDKAKGKTVVDASPAGAPAAEVAAAASPNAQAQKEPVKEVIAAAPEKKDQPKAEQFNPDKVRSEKESTQQAAMNEDNDDTHAATKEESEETPKAPEKKTIAASVAPKEQAKPVTTPANPVPAKGARVQLSASKSEAEAKTTWTRIAKKFANDVQGKEHYILRADLGSKGVFYRLQMGPFSSTKAAEEFCFSLVSQGQGCIVAHTK